LFAFDLPFLFICGILLGILGRNNKITVKINWFLNIFLLFVFQAGGIMLWLDVIPGSKEFMIIPLNIFGFTTNDFEPILAPILFALEPFLLVLGQEIILKLMSSRESTT
jgi:hypothetical protein